MTYKQESQIYNGYEKTDYWSGNRKRGERDGLWIYSLPPFILSYKMGIYHGRVVLTEPGPIPEEYTLHYSFRLMGRRYGQEISGIYDRSK